MLFVSIITDNYDLFWRIHKKGQNNCIPKSVFSKLFANKKGRHMHTYESVLSLRPLCVGSWDHLLEIACL